MKRNFYIVSFTFLGILLQLIAHSLIEMWYIGLLLADFPKFGFGFTWNTWVLIHNILTVLFFFGGAWIGYKEGVYWWRRIYEENSIARWREEWRKKLETVSVIKLIIAGIILMGFSAAWFHLENIGVLLRPGQQRACTMEALQCPDGSYVGRTGPKCEFAVCPEIQTKWKIFENKKLGYSINYPTSYFAKPGTDADCFSATEGDSDAPGFCVLIHENPEKISLHAWWRKNTFNSDHWIESAIKVDNKDALFFETAALDGFPESAVIFAKDDIIIEIWGTSLSNELLDSFKFIERLDQIDISMWKTYRNEEYGFEVKYPGDWKFLEEHKPVDAFFVVGEESRFGILPLGEYDYGVPGDAKKYKKIIGDKEADVDEWKLADNSILIHASWINPQSNWSRFSNRLDILIYSEESQKIIDQILSTFKFIDNNNNEFETAHVKNIIKKNDKYTLTLIAVKYEGCQNCPDGYRMVNLNTTKDFPVLPKTNITVVSDTLWGLVRAGVLESDVPSKTVNFYQLINLINSKDFDAIELIWGLFDFSFKDNSIIEIKQRYLP